ncbi:hypothetical protein H4R18_002149 [Coemansia javaensis]|uniref:RNA recognition motif domain-containing protein n=1 Tax=Coemansia javaensis TaxID=2761396 RepID=A0A9W8HFD0_9FUNG|nr:hypothetical protein H4R18_002149 [Coemansia javaensis]
MSLFGDLPPPEPDPQDGAEHPRPPPPDGAARAWARPALRPNLRRPRPAPASRHPHDPALLAARWQAAAAAGEQPVEKPPPPPPPPPATAEPTEAEPKPDASRSLARYLPPPVPHPRGRRRGPAEFDPHEEYNPAAPNDYQAYCAWAAAQKQARAQVLGDSGSSDAGPGDDDDDCDEADDRRDPGEPSVCVVLTNMVDALDDELERETMDECSAFGAVVRCAATEDAGAASPFERVRVVVEFAELDAAVRAQEALDRRLFGGRRISAAFLPLPPATAQHDTQ